MNFTLPTTKSEMFQTLKTIYSHYRLNSASYLASSRQTLTLTRLTFSAQTDSQLAMRAEDLIDGDFEREKRKTEEELNTNLDSLNDKKQNIIEEYEKIFASVNSKYDNLKSQLKEEASKKGLSYSSVLTEKMYEVENNRANEILSYQTKKAEKIAEIDGKISAVQTKISGLTNYFNQLKAKDIQAKTILLKSEQDKIVRDIAKYNNTLQEKEVSSYNAGLTEQKNLELKFLEIKSKGLTKEELVNNGYYEDVMTCMSGYYNTLSAVSAYNDILTETRLIQYLEDFYEDFVYIYKQRALA